MTALSNLLGSFVSAHSLHLCFVSTLKKLVFEFESWLRDEMSEEDSEMDGSSSFRGVDEVKGEEGEEWMVLYVCHRPDKTAGSDDVEGRDEGVEMN